MPEYESFHVRDEGAVIVIEFKHQELSGIAVHDRLSSDLNHLIEDRLPERLLISFAGVKIASSDAIGVFIQARKQLKPSGGVVKMCCMHENVRLSFQILKLEGSLFEILESEADGIAAFDR